MVKMTKGFQTTRHHEQTKAACETLKKLLRFLSAAVSFIVLIRPVVIAGSYRPGRQAASTATTQERHDVTGAYCAYEGNMRETIIQFFVDEGFKPADLFSDNEVTRRTRANKHADDLMLHLGRVRETYGSPF